MRSFTDVLENRYSWKFRKVNKKAPVLESLFNKVAGEVIKNILLQKISSGCFCGFCNKTN